MPGQRPWAGGPAPAPGPDHGPARRRLDRLLTRAAYEAGAYGGGIYLMVPEEEALRLEVLTGVPAEFAAPWSRVSLAAALPAADAVRGRGLVWVGAEGELARRYPRAALVLPYHFRLAAAPIMSGDTALGVLLLLWSGSSPEQLADEVRTRIDDACAAIAEVLRQTAGEEPMPPMPSPRVLPQPRATSIGPAEALSAAALAERLPEGWCALDLDGHITFITRNGARLVGRDVQDLIGFLPWEALSWLDDPVYEDRYRAAVISREPTVFTAMRPPRHWLTFQLYPDATGLSVRISPVHVQDTSEQPGDRIARPADPTRVGSIYQLMHLAGSLTEAASVRDVVDLAADHLIPAFGARGLVLMVAESGKLRLVGHRGYRADLLRVFDGTPLSAPTPGVRSLTEGIPSFFATRSELEEAYPFRRGMRDGMEAWAYLPLIASGRPVGTCVLGYDRPHTFPPDERVALGSLSGLIAQALDRARLYDTKHQLAHGLQQGLLPHSLPQLPGLLEVAARYRPSTQGMDIGGDFYDLIHLDPLTVGAVIGDVQGHNVTAAALMGQVRTAVHAHAGDGAPPGEVLSRTNRLLTDLDPGLFTSCLYARLDLSSHRALLASAGHPPPLLHIPGRGTEVLDVPPGLLLGIDPETDYPTVDISVPPGSILAFYTDGLVETPGTDLGESIAELADRLSRMGREERLDDIADTLVRLADGVTLDTDDLALLLLRPS